MFWCSESLDFYIKPYPVSVILCFIKSRCGLCCFVVLLMTRDWFINWINWWGAYWLPGTAVDTWDTAVNERAKSAWPHQAYILVWETDNEHYCITQIRQKAVFLRGQEGGRWLSKQYIRVTPEQPDGRWAGLRPPAGMSSSCRVKYLEHSPLFRPHPSKLRFSHWSFSLWRQ